MIDQYYTWRIASAITILAAFFEQSQAVPAASVVSHRVFNIQTFGLSATVKKMGAERRPAL
jgi:hypothetical protein